MASACDRRDAATVSASLIRDTVRMHERGSDFRLHWMALGAAGLRVGESLHIPNTLPVVLDVAIALGAERVLLQSAATMVILHRPTENQLLSMVNRLREGVRLLVYNEDSDIQGMFDRTFDLATACIFDQQSKKVVRIYDKECKVQAYIEVELGDLSDSSISMHASRIATLR